MVESWCRSGRSVDIRNDGFECGVGAKVCKEGRVLPVTGAGKDEIIESFLDLGEGFPLLRWMCWASVSILKPLSKDKVEWLTSYLLVDVAWLDGRRHLVALSSEL